MSDKIDRRLAAIEKRLTRLERASPPAPAIPHSAAASPSDIFSIPDDEQPSPFSFRPGNWLGIIAVICFVLAAAFIIKLAVDSGWLTPERQLGLAALFGLGLVSAGIALLKSDRSYASLLPGAGVIVLYLTAFAAHKYYDFISFELAIALTALVSGLCIWLYVLIRHDAYALTAAVGAYIAPALIGVRTDAIFSLYYFVICSAAFATISIWVKSRTLTLVSAYLALCMTGLVGFGLGQPETIAGLLALHFVVFSLGTYGYTLYNRRGLSTLEAWSLMPVLLVFYTLEYHYLNHLFPDAAPWIALGFAALLLGLYLSAKKYVAETAGGQTMALAFATIVGFHAGYLELLPEDVRPWLFVVILLGITFLPRPALLPDEDGFSPLQFPLLGIAAIFMIEYVSMIFHLLHKADADWLAVSFAALVSLWASLLATNSQLPKQPSLGHALLGMAHVLAISGLYRLTLDCNSLVVSASWLAYAVAVMAVAFLRKDEVMAKSALFVLIFAAGKALLYDAAAAATLVRIGCLLLTGAVLYGCGLFMRRLGSWTLDSKKPLAQG